MTVKWESSAPSILKSQALDLRKRLSRVVTTNLVPDLKISSDSYLLSYYTYPSLEPESPDAGRQGLESPLGLDFRKLDGANVAHNDLVGGGRRVDIEDGGSGGGWSWWIIITTTTIMTTLSTVECPEFPSRAAGWRPTTPPTTALRVRIRSTRHH
jgi:hypothetical protein